MLTLLLFVFGPPLVLFLLGRRFWKLRHLADLTGRARTVRVGWLVLLASGLTGSFYLLVLVVSVPLPSSPHAASSSIWPWGQEHPLTVVGLVSLVSTFLLLAHVDQRLAGLSFGAGALLVVSGLGVSWYLTGYQEELLQQRQANLVYKDSGWQRAVIDSFKRQEVRCHSLDEVGVTAPTFPGGEAALARQVTALLGPHPPFRSPYDAVVQVAFIVEPTGHITLPHVVVGLGPGFDEEAVRVVRHLPSFSPALGSDRQPVAVVWHVAIPFFH